jgi:hypothetical protein
LARFNDSHTRFELRRIVGLPSRREVPDESRTYTLELHIGVVGEAEHAAFRLEVSTPAGFDEVDGPEVLSDRARLVVAELDWERIRTYLVSLVRACTEKTLHQALPVFARYFVDVAEPPVAPTAAQRRTGAIELRGIDPPWQQSSEATAFHLTFGVAGRFDAVAAEFSVAIVTPAALRGAAEHGPFILAHRATIVFGELDWPIVQAHLRALVEQRCAAPSLNDARTLLQRYFRMDWEEDLAYGIEV